MRYRHIDLFSRVFGIAWTAASLFAAGLGFWIIWNGQLWIGLGFVGAGALSTAIGMAIAFERDPRRREHRFRNEGPLPNVRTLLFFLCFLVAGLAALGGIAMPAVIKGMETGKWGEAITGVVIALASLGSGGGGLWVIFKKHRKQRQRSLKAAQEVAEAREKRRRSKPQRKRKCS